tara:strand:- start:330 stop:587 length:258 start_codon:yes stop_codon:yes gene_type:complete
MLTFLILEISYTSEASAEKNNFKKGLLNKFCIATLKSKLDVKNKNNFTEISNFTCKCFLKKYNSGFSIRKSRIYCRDKASEKFNL